MQLHNFTNVIIMLMFLGGVMIKLLKYMQKKEWFYAFFGVIFIVFNVWLELKIPEYMSTITALVQTPGSEMSEILKNGGYMLVCAVASAITSVVVGYVAAIVSTRLSRRIRSKIFDKVVDFNHRGITDS